MWEPEIGWRPVPVGGSASTLGVWRAEVGGRSAIVKRFVRPEGDPAFDDPTSYAYWRREGEVALDGIVSNTPGLRAPEVLDVAEDADGITVVSVEVVPQRSAGLYLAHAIGRFAAAPLPARGWLARNQLRDRLTRIEARGGWPILGRTTASDVANHLWSRRGHFLAALDQAPPVAQHGDPTQANLLGRAGADAIALDWSTLGTGALGADLGLLVLGLPEEFEPLLDAYLKGYSASAGAPLTKEIAQGAALAARVSAIFTAFSRAEWALSRVAGGEGALAGKFRHPAVAPYLRALARLGPQIETLM